MFSLVEQEVNIFSFETGLSWSLNIESQNCWNWKRLLRPSTPTAQLELVIPPVLLSPSETSSLSLSWHFSHVSVLLGACKVQVLLTAVLSQSGFLFSPNCLGACKGRAA